MKIREVLASVDATKPNAFDDAQKIRYINEVEGMVQSEVFLFAPEEIITYDESDMETELLVSAPHDRIYPAYLAAMIDFANGEYNKYANSIQLFNDHFTEFERWFTQNYRPADTHSELYENENGLIGSPWRGYYLTAYGIAVKLGFVGTEAEWLASLRGEKGDAFKYEDFTEEQLEALRGELINGTLAEAEAAKTAAENAAAEAESKANEAATLLSSVQNLARGVASVHSAVGEMRDEAKAAEAEAKRQAENIGSAAQDAKNSADAAENSAKEALAHLNSAATEKENARKEAENAENHAIEAASSAGIAKNLADSARLAAQRAASSESGAKESENAAKKYAESIIGAVNESAENADRAEEAAKEALTYTQNLETAASGAENAKTAAEKAAEDAEGSAKNADLSAKDAAESEENAKNSSISALSSAERAEGAKTAAQKIAEDAETTTRMIAEDAAGYASDAAEKALLAENARAGAEDAATRAGAYATDSYNFANEAAALADSAGNSATEAAKAAEEATSAVEKKIKVITEADIPLEVGFENGGISSSGSLTNSTAMLRSVDYIEVAGKEVEFYSTDNNVVLYVCEYDENKTFLKRRSVSSGLIGSPREEAYYIKLLLYSSKTETYPQSTLAEYLVWECKNPLSLEYLHEKTVINQKKGSYAFDNILIKSINHRGYHDIAPENTLPAYRLSKQKGFDFAECDVAVTSDGAFVLCHDATINRTARNADGTEIATEITVSDVTYDELLTYDFGIWKGAAYAGTKIPTFEEFIVLCRNIGLYPYIELKMLPEVFPQEVANNLVGIVKKYGMEKAVTYLSFTNANLAKIAVADKNARLGLLSKSLTEYALQKFALPLFTGANEVFIDHDSGTLTDEIITLCQKYGLPLEVYCPNVAENIASGNPYITGYTSDRIIAKDVVFEANIGATGTGL